MKAYIKRMRSTQHALPKTDESMRRAARRTKPLTNVRIHAPRCAAHEHFEENVRIHAPRRAAHEHTNKQTNKHASTQAKRALRPKGSRVGKGLSGGRKQIVLTGPKQWLPVVSGVYTVRILVSKVPASRTASAPKTLIHCEIRAMHNRIG